MEESTNQVLDNNPPVGEGTDAAHIILEKAREAGLDMESAASPEIHKSSLVSGISEKGLTLEQERLDEALINLEVIKDLLDERRDLTKYLKDQYMLEKSTLLHFTAEEQASGVRQKRVPWSMGFEVRDHARIEPPELGESTFPKNYVETDPRLSGYYTGRNYRMPLDVLCYVTPILYRYTVKDKYEVVSVDLGSTAKIVSRGLKIEQNNFRNRYHKTLSSALDSVIHTAVRKLGNVDDYLRGVKCWKEDLVCLKNSVEDIKHQEGLPHTVPSPIKKLVEVASDLIKTEDSKNNFDLKNLDL